MKPQGLRAMFPSLNDAEIQMLERYIKQAEQNAYRAAYTAGMADADRVNRITTSKKEAEA